MTEFTENIKHFGKISDLLRCFELTMMNFKQAKIKNEFFLTQMSLTLIKLWSINLGLGLLNSQIFQR